MATALQTLPDAQIVAVGSRSQESADGFAAEFDITRAHPSHAALCADPDVDIIYVASPHSEHRAMTIAALDAGKHVVCEKAVALNSTEATEIGALLDLGIYPLTFASFLLGEYPDSVHAVGRLTDDGVDATVGGVASYPGGAISTFRTSLDGCSSLGARVVGTAGRIDVQPPFWFASAFTVHRTEDAPAVDPERVEIPNQGLAHEAAHAMERIRAGHLESDVVTLTSSLQAMRLLDDVRAQIGVVSPSETPTRTHEAHSG